MKQLGVKQLAGVVVGIAIVLIGAWYVALIRPESHKLKTTHAAEASAQSQISNLDTQINQLDVYKAHLAQDKQALATFQQEIPSSPQLSSVIRQIQTAALDNGVSLNSLDPTVESGSDAVTVGGATVLPVSMSVTGTYAQLMSFVNSLTSMTRTIVINTISLAGTGTTLTDSMSGDIFYTGQSSGSSN